MGGVEPAVADLGAFAVVDVGAVAGLGPAAVLAVARREGDWQLAGGVDVAEKGPDRPQLGVSTFGRVIVGEGARRMADLPGSQVRIRFGDFRKPRRVRRLEPWGATSRRRSSSSRSPSTVSRSKHLSTNRE